MLLFVRCCVFSVLCLCCGDNCEKCLLYCGMNYLLMNGELFIGRKFLCCVS